MRKDDAWEGTVGEEEDKEEEEEEGEEEGGAGRTFFLSKSNYACIRGMVTCRRIFISSITHTHTVLRQKLSLSLSFAVCEFPEGGRSPTARVSPVVHPSFTILRQRRSTRVT